MSEMGVREWDHIIIIIVVLVSSFFFIGFIILAAAIKVDRGDFQA